MKSKERIWIGIDPGGIGKFGLAILVADKVTHVCCVDHVDEAIQVFREKLVGIPLGVGIDAPLWWSSGRSSDRHVDQWLRQHYALSGYQVQASNSLQGSALVQAAMFVHRIRQIFPAIGVTETHPKALLAALNQDGSEFFSQYKVNVKTTSEHGRDAAISAIAAREGFEGRWSRDLSKIRLPSELDPLEFWLAPVHYYWPHDPC